jgi:Zn-finger nucleic acid-binding protein
MHWIKVGEVDLLECADCDGTWIETSVFEKLCAQRERQAAVVKRKPEAATTGPPRQSERVRYRPCPQCGKMMNRLNFGRLSGAIVDVCSGHGTFLDRGELHHVVQFILDGGLERTRTAQLAQLKEEEQRIRELLSQLSRSHGGGSL